MQAMAETAARPIGCTMVAERRISEEELSEHLHEVLRDVEGRGERVAITRNGVVVATIQPASSRFTSAREVREKIGHLRFPGDGFGDDLEWIQAQQQPIGKPPSRDS
jgi:antitoxin (DNA-binding transcriptional repressor) of toxin-antitoxin stability system